MKPVEEVTACVIDQGMFMPLAEKLGEKMAKVYYYTPWEKRFPDIRDTTIGDGVELIERENDFFKEPMFSKIDLFVFPNNLYSGMQEHLESIGKAVWGSRSGAELEMWKGQFYRTLEEIGLEVPEHEKIVGLDNLRDHLKEHEDLFIKISFYRETMDTWHHIDYAHSEGDLDRLAMKLGPFKNLITFYVIDPIKTEIEGGIDNYCIDGHWPDYAVLGYEKKDETYLATVKPFDEMPKVYTKINEAIAPILATYHYRNFFSTEIRVKGETSFFIDPTCRMPSPAGEEQLELYGNIADIIWRGAHGELVQPEITADFAAESLLHHTGFNDQWKSLEVPREIRKWVKLYGCAEVGAVSWWPPSDEDIIGCVVGIGNTLGKVIDHMKSTVEALGNAPVKIDFSSFPSLLSQIETAEEKGIEFSDKPLPEPAEVIDQS